MNYETIKQNYLRGLWCKTLVQKAMEKGVITKAQFDEIIAAKK